MVNKASSFKYTGRSSEDISRRATQPSGAYDSFISGGFALFKPKEGENCVRILPWLSGNDPRAKEYQEKWGNHWGIDIYVHYNVGPDNGSYLCLQKMKGETCPVCEARRDADEKEAQALRIVERVLCWIVDRKNEKLGPTLWAMPTTLSKDISGASRARGSGENLLIDDPEEGYDIYFDREGVKIQTDYKRVEAARDPTPLHENPDKMAQWLNYVSENVLPDLLVYYDADLIEKTLFGQKATPAERSGRRPSERRDDDNSEQSFRSNRRSREDNEDVAAGGLSRRRGQASDYNQEEDTGSLSRDEDLGQRSRRRGSADDGGNFDREDRTRRNPPGHEEPQEDDTEENVKSRRPVERFSGSARQADALEEDAGGDSDDRSVESAKGRLSRLGRRGSRE